jgi:hypothetical protein
MEKLLRPGCPFCNETAVKQWPDDAPAPYTGKYTYTCGYSSRILRQETTPCSRQTQIQKCICPISTIMTSGCKCGAFQKEKKNND